MKVIMTLLLLLAVLPEWVGADGYADYDKYSQGIVDHAGVAARHHNTGSPDAVSSVTFHWRGGDCAAAAL